MLPTALRSCLLVNAMMLPGVGFCAELRAIAWLTKETANAVVDAHMGKQLNLDAIENLGMRHGGQKDQKLEELIAGILSLHNGELFLPGLKHLSSNAAKKLANHQGPLLSLNGLCKLDPATADALAGYKGELGLLGLQDLDNEPLAKKLAAQNRPGGFLVLNGLQSLSKDAADYLAEHNATGLAIPSLRDLKSSKLARKLAGQNGDVVLDGLQVLSPEIAKELAQHKGFLSLNGLKEIEVESAEHLSKSECDLVLGGLKAIPSMALAIKLGQAPNQPAGGKLVLSRLQVITPEIAKALVAQGRSVVLPALDNISPEVAEAFANQAAGTLELDNLRLLPIDVAQALAKYKGDRLTLRVRDPLPPGILNLLQQNPKIFVQP